MNYKRWVIVALVLFSIGLALGLVAPSQSASFFAEDIKALKEMSHFVSSLPRPLAAMFIFTRNALTVVISFIFSPLLCLLPILALLVNGWLISFVSAAVLHEKSVGFLLAGLLPHGILELPALILGQAAALSFGAAVILALLRMGRRQLLPTLKQDLKYLGLTLALLLPAAIIEIYLTPLLLTYFG